MTLDEELTANKEEEELLTGEHTTKEDEVTLHEAGTTKQATTERATEEATTERATEEATTEAPATTKEATTKAPATTKATTEATSKEAATTKEATTKEAAATTTKELHTTAYCPQSGSDCAHTHNACSAATPTPHAPVTAVACQNDKSQVCVKQAGQPCTVRTGFISVEDMADMQSKPMRKCAAPMVCMRDWHTEDSGVCVFDSVGMPCLGNNLLGDCKTLNMEPNAYCVEGRCKRGPSFPGDHCWTNNDCTAGASCVRNACVGVQEGGLCTNQFRLCDSKYYCPNAPPGHARCTKCLALGAECLEQFSIINLIQGQGNGVNECVVGAHCRDGRCVADDSIKGELGEHCTGHVIGTACNLGGGHG